MSDTEETVMVPLGDREIEMRKPTDGALVVLARVSRGLPTTKIENVDEIPEAVRGRIIRDLGTVGRFVEAMIVKTEDKDWLDDAMIWGDVTAIDVFDTCRIVAEKFNANAKNPAKPTAAVRRRAS